MNVQRFLAPTSREAMAKVRNVFGDSAVILSSRSTDAGFEVVATAEENLDQLANSRPRARQMEASVQAQAPRRSLQDRASLERPSLGSSQSSVEQDTETLAMSTLSFQDYVRERMLRKRREMMGADKSAVAPVPASPTRYTDAVNTPPRLAQHAPELTRQAAAPTRPAPEAVPLPPAGPSPVEARLTGELNALKDMIEERFNTLSWLGASRQNPIQSSLMLKLIRAGYSAAVARAVLERMPPELNAVDAFRWTQDVLIRNLKTADATSSLCDEGGVYALMGATGVGKTTTAAKLAAQCVKSYGANSVGLITLDTYRVAGYEQLRSYGRMLGVVAHLAHDRAALQDLLALLANKRMVIIDTAGLGQHDPRIEEMLELLGSNKIKKLLVLNAGSHGDTLDDVINAYKGSDLYGVILSKLDEAPKLGPALDSLIRHQMLLRGVSTGQRVPEDWQRADAAALVRQSMASTGKSAYDPQASELGLFFSQPAGGQVNLDAWNA
ncbi:flagellar biosynthesis protein FlhF [Hydrogenophaga sp. OTU3427]|uniref:flagellar biosynthesis protein FlhF n=1 Tax=Hydrogenophaga sp. OTU3427 TaxID=3043856 RepID=UPI00313C16FF